MATPTAQEVSSIAVLGCLLDPEIALPVPAEELITVHESLDSLEAINPQAARLVKLRYFAGFSLEQAASALSISSATAYRHWAYARAYLRCSLLDDRS